MSTSTRPFRPFEKDQRRRTAEGKKDFEWQGGDHRPGIGSLIWLTLWPIYPALLGDGLRLLQKKI